MIGIPLQSDADASATVVERVAPAHMAQWPVFLLRRALSPSTSTLDDDYPILTIRLLQDERRWARHVLDALIQGSDKSFAKIVIGVFADATGAKCYDEGWWKRFLEGIRARHPDYAIVEIAPPDGRSRLSSRFPVFSSPSPREVAAVIANMNCFVSADCGVMHLASASDTPTIGLFCVTDLAKYGPYGPHNKAIDTIGKTPEQIARLASEAAEAASSRVAGSYSQSRAPRLGHADRSDSHRQQDECSLPVARGGSVASR
ncbi:MAG: glycosyltransferase family 9 protein [Rudaea sp.]